MRKEMHIGKFKRTIRLWVVHADPRPSSSRRRKPRQSIQGEQQDPKGKSRSKNTRSKMIMAPGSRN